MSVPRLRTIALAAVASLGLTGCAYDGYGYGSASIGYGGYYGDFYDPYYYDAYPGYYGWYGGFYYPGAGFYVYDRRGKRHRWNDHHRRHWEGRRGDRRDRNGQGNWSGFNRSGQQGTSSRGIGAGPSPRQQSSRGERRGQSSGRSQSRSQPSVNRAPPQPQTQTQGSQGRMGGRGGGN